MDKYFILNPENMELLKDEETLETLIFNTFFSADIFASINLKRYRILKLCILSGDL
jgi:hypothetical protein